MGEERVSPKGESTGKPLTSGDPDKKNWKVRSNREVGAYPFRGDLKEEKSPCRGVLKETGHHAGNRCTKLGGKKYKKL